MAGTSYTYKKKSPSRRKFDYYRFTLGIGLFLSFGLFIFIWWRNHQTKNRLLSSPFAIWLVSINLATFALFAGDKAASKVQGAPRMPELVLHIVTLLGGMVGQHFGRSLFHHKTNIQRHPSFRRVQILSILIWGVLAFRRFRSG